VKFDPNKHDPIINPIGAYIPKPMNGGQYGKGRGLALLNAGSNVLSH